LVQNLPEFKGKAPNVLVIYIDALSRATAHRKIPKTLDWFKKQGEDSTFEFFRYNTMDAYTVPNILEIIWGLPKSEFDQ